MRTCHHASIFILFLPACFAMPANAAKLTPLPEAPAILEKIYSFDLAGAVEAAKRMEV
jgi:hypothetical protein